MEYKCPRCNKLIVLSQDELLSQGNHVVCPQCLLEFTSDGHIATEEDNYAIGYRQSVKPSAGVFACNKCGGELHADFHFCPYCGRAIAQVYQQTTPAAHVTQQQTAQGKTTATTPPAVPPQAPMQNAQFVPSYRYGYRQPSKPRRSGCVTSLLMAAVLIAIVAIFFIFNLARL